MLYERKYINRCVHICGVYSLILNNYEMIYFEVSLPVPNMFKGSRDY